MITQNFAMEKPAPSTFFFIASISTGEFFEKVISKTFLFRSVVTLSINGTVFNVLLIALLHMEQVRPLAWNSTFCNCALTKKGITNSDARINIFIFCVFIKENFRMINELLRLL